MKRRVKRGSDKVETKMCRKSGLSVPAARFGKCEPWILPLAEAAKAAAQPSPSPAPSSLMTEEEYAGCISVYY